MSNESKIYKLRIEAYKNAAGAMNDIKDPAKKEQAYRASMMVAHELERMVGTHNALKKIGLG